MAAYLIGEIDMIKVRYQKMYTEEHEKDMDFVVIGDCYIGPFIDRGRADKAVDVIVAHVEPKQEEKQKLNKFAKVEESIFDLKEEFEKGELYFEGAAVAAISGGVFLSNDEYVKINSKESLCECYANGNVYRQAEVDWRESVIGLAPAGYGLDRSLSHRLSIEGSYDKGQALILANAIIESLTDKPE